MSAARKSSYPAQAGYPVRRGLSIDHYAAGIPGRPVRPGAMTAEIQISNSGHGLAISRLDSPEILPARSESKLRVEY